MGGFLGFRDFFLPLGRRFSSVHLVDVFSSERLGLHRLEEGQGIVQEPLRKQHGAHAWSPCRPFPRAALPTEKALNRVGGPPVKGRCHSRK